MIKIVNSNKGNIDDVNLIKKELEQALFLSKNIPFKVNIFFTNPIFSL